MTIANLQLELQGLSRELRRRRRRRLMVRSVWLALLWVALCFAVPLLGRRVPLLFVVAPAVVIGLAGWLYALFTNPSFTKLTRTYDQRYQLDQQLASALEVARRPNPTGIGERLIEQATLTLRQLRYAVVTHPLVPRREWEAVGIVALLIAALFFATGPALPAGEQPLSLPPLPSPVAQAEATPPPDEQAADQPASATPGPLDAADQAAVEAIADALRDTGATRPAADALDRGDAPGAAEQLRELAEQADQLSPTTREDLASELQGAADQLRPTQPDLAEQLDDVADQMNQDPAEALDDLAQALDELGDEGQTAQEGADPGQAPSGGQGPEGDQQGTEPPNGSGGGAGDQLPGERRNSGDEPPQAGGENLPLPTPVAEGGPMTSATGPEGPKVELGAGGTSNAPPNAGGGGANAPLPGEADPLRIPVEDRDVVENYFSPAP